MQPQAKFFRIAIFAALCWTMVMRLFSPPHIVQFELAGTTSVATEIITSWGTEGVAKAKTSTYLDFIYIICYSAAIALGCRVASQYSNKKILIKIGSAFSILTMVAGACDVIENVAMLKSLQDVTQTTVSVAYYFAIVKFTILFTALSFALIAFAVGGIEKMRSR